LDWDEYSRELHELWKKYDKDQSGFLEREEAFKFIDDMFKITAKVLSCVTSPLYSCYQVVA
jgi:hypothetical protein